MQNKGWERHSCKHQGGVEQGQSWEAAGYLWDLARLESGHLRLTWLLPETSASQMCVERFVE